MEPPPRILVIDDDQHQLDTVCRGLRLYGYRCQGARSAEAALAALASEERSGVDLVLADLTIPGRFGLELIERVREARPDLPVVVVTGLAPGAELGFVRGPRILLLRKPFDPEVLDTAIRQALGTCFGYHEVR